MHASLKTHVNIHHVTMMFHLHISACTEVNFLCLKGTISKLIIFYDIMQLTDSNTLTSERGEREIIEVFILIKTSCYKDHISWLIRSDFVCITLYESQQT